MTAIACWIQRDVITPSGVFHQPTLWAVADSRVAEPRQERQTGEIGYHTLHEHAPKIFSIPIIIKCGDESGRFTRIVYRSSIGLACAGSGLIGTAVSLAAASLLDSLIVLNDTLRPRLLDVASLVARLLRDYVRALGLERAIAECAVMGFCPQTNEAEIFAVRPQSEIGEPCGVTAAKIDTSQMGAYLFLGDRGDDIRCLIDEERALHTLGTAEWWRAPSTVIQRCISDNRFPTVGGTVQVGIGDSHGFKPRWVLHRRPGNKGFMDYLGLGIVEEQLHIGPCLIGMEGMDIGILNL